MTWSAQPQAEVQPEAGPRGPARQAPVRVTMARPSRSLNLAARAGERPMGSGLGCEAGEDSERASISAGGPVTARAARMAPPREPVA